MANLPLAFGEILVGGIVLLAGVSGHSIAEVMSGNVSIEPLTGGGSSGGSSSGNTTNSSGQIVVGTPNAKGMVNPIPGAVASRLDQGIDATGKTFVSPYNGKVVYSVQSDPGWAGGGYIAVANATNPNQVTYFAEGISPTRSVGDMVKAGEIIGLPVSNPYNQVVGNIEMGPANPSTPQQPLAQVVGNRAQVVDTFYQWLLSLGGPHATSTSNAGFP